MYAGSLKTGTNLDAIIARLESSRSTRKVKEDELLEMPTCYEDFLKIAKLEYWPTPVRAEKPTDMKKKRLMIGSTKDIVDSLKKATPIHGKLLKDLEEKLQGFEKQLWDVADLIIESPLKLEKSERESLPRSVNRAFLTDLTDFDSVKARPSNKIHRKRESLTEQRAKCVEHCPFPGFVDGELTGLPGQLEAPQIMHRVTKAQDFTAGFKKFWKKVFQSEASITMMHDTFWWIYIKRFGGSKYLGDRNKLFDRISDSFVALFMSINREVKDKIFEVFVDCMAQAVFAAFYQAFPESEKQFQDDFKQYVVSTIATWVGGFSPPPGTWKKWNLSRLESKVHTKTTEDGPTHASKAQPTKSDGVFSLDIDDVTRTIANLGQPEHRMARTADNMVRETTKASGIASSLPVEGVATAPLPLSRLAQCGTPRKIPAESHVVGPGPDYCQRLFHIHGRSPLVDHYIEMLHLKQERRIDRKVTRTEAESQPNPDDPTYKQLIKTTMARQTILSKEYQRVCDNTFDEIARIRRETQKSNYRMEALKRQIMHTKGVDEFKVISDKIRSEKEQGHRTSTPRNTNFNSRISRLDTTKEEVGENSYTAK